MRRALIALLLSLAMLVSIAPAASAGPWETIWCLQDWAFTGYPESPAECHDAN